MIKKSETLVINEGQSTKATLTAKPLPTEKKAGCCTGAKESSTATQTSGSLQQKSSTAATFAANSDSKKAPKTRITVKYDTGFGNHLFLRGKGANLCWDKGIAFKNVKNDEWMWETDVAFISCEFKVSLNDNCYEIGENHTLTCGASIQYTPRF